MSPILINLLVAMISSVAAFGFILLIAIKGDEPKTTERLEYERHVHEIYGNTKL